MYRFTIGDEEVVGYISQRDFGYLAVTRYINNTGPIFVKELDLENFSVLDYIEQVTGFTNATNKFVASDTIAFEMDINSLDRYTFGSTDIEGIKKLVEPFGQFIDWAIYTKDNRIVFWVEFKDYDPTSFQ